MHIISDIFRAAVNSKTVTRQLITHWVASSNLAEHRRTQDFTMERVYVVGAWPEGLGYFRPPVGSRDKAPVGDLGEKSTRS